MATVTGQSIRALINKVENTEGFRVTDMGVRWKIINDDGGRQVFVNKRPPLNNTMKPITDALASIGWEEEVVEEAKQNGRAKRLADDRDRNEARLQAAIRAAEQAAEQAKLDEKNRTDAKALSAVAFDIGYGHRKAILVIDAAFARALLEHNRFFVPQRAATAPVGRCNRPFDRRLQDYYAGQMLRDEWKLSHQGIAMDTEGMLIDGQHRLAALVKAAETNPNVSFVTEVTYDLDPEVMGVVDAGKARRITDFLAFKNEANRHLLAATVTMLWKYYTYPFEDWGRVGKMSNEQMYAYLQERPEIRDVVRRGGLARNVTIGSSAAAFLHIVEGVYRDAPTEDFMYGIRTGYGLADGDARAAFRAFNERIRRGGPRRRTDQVEQLALLIKTWNFWLMGRPWKTASWKVTEDFPQPIERD